MHYAAGATAEDLVKGRTAHDGERGGDQGQLGYDLNTYDLRDFDVSNDECSPTRYYVSPAFTPPRDIPMHHPPDLILIDRNSKGRGRGF